MAGQCILRIEMASECEQHRGSGWVFKAPGVVLWPVGALGVCTSIRYFPVSQRQSEIVQPAEQFTLDYSLCWS